ncbi:MAG TPA: hypothetical protein VK338_03855 [Candidatus Nitrosocosmicus sp.]|nr:hypothetical protein [Candidatus Nitrosocosmicus sp.]
MLTPEHTNDHDTDVRKNLPITQENLEVIDKELKAAFPDSSLTVQIQSNDACLFYGDKDEANQEKPIYYASAVKPIVVAVALEKATREKIEPHDPVIPIHLTSPFIYELYADLFDTEREFPYVSCMIPSYVDSEEFHTFINVLKSGSEEEVNESMRNIHDYNTRLVAEALVLEHFSAHLTDEEEIKAAHGKKNDFYEKYSSTELGKTNLQQLIRSTLGPSSNVTLGVMFDFIDPNFRTARDHVQTRVDEILGPDNLFTVNNSSKEQRTGLWNAGKLTELTSLFRHILNDQGEFDISPEYRAIMIAAMEEEYADQVIERLKVTSQSTDSRVIGKSGYYNLDVLPGLFNSMDVLMKVHNWDPHKWTYVSYILDMPRIIHSDGQATDVAVAIGIPHNDADNSMRQAIKIKATEIVMQQIAQRML